MPVARLTATLLCLALSAGVRAAPNLTPVHSQPAARAQASVGAQVSIPARWLQGYSRAVAGERLVYPWAYPGHASALLTRTTDGRMRVEWEAEIVPPGITDERVTFLWHAGIASGYGAHRFALEVNGHVCATFTSGRDANGDREWRVEGAGGCALAFKTTRVGAFNELFGLMLATVPRTAVAGGAPRFAVTGEAAGSDDYYMTFMEPVAAWARFTAEEARLKDGARVLSLDVSRIDNPASAVVHGGGETLWSGTIETGYSNLLVPLRAMGADVQATLTLDGIVVLSQRVPLTPVRPWEIHLLPHSHVDIGYSDPQPVVERKQWKNLRDAVQLAASTRGRPPEARFRWNVEGLWSVESYIAQAGEDERTAFLAAVRAGSIDMQATYTNLLTGLATPAELERWTDAARRLRQAYDVPEMVTAMQTDIPGLSWTVVRALARAGVRYVSSGPNYMPTTPDGGDRIGGTLRALGDKPFWWESPSRDERVLFWMAGRGYSWFHGMNAGPIARAGEQALLAYLRELRAERYPYDMVQVRYTIGGDNGPVDPDLPEFVERWNERFETPRLVINTVRGLFGEFERRYGTRLPVRRGDMTPYWEDGAASTAIEEAKGRAAARRLQQAEALWALRNPSGYPAGAFADAWRDVILWHEHTWGAADSVSRPDRPDVVSQWEYKRRFALQAERSSLDLLNGARAAAGDAFEAINTLSWDRDGLVFLDRPDVPRGNRAADGAGRPLPSQRLADGRLAVLVTAVPALGAARFRLVPGPAAPPRTPVRVTAHSLENGRVRVVIDPATGDIVSLRLAGRPETEYVGRGGLHAFRYVPGLDPAAAVPPGRPRVTVEEPGPLVATLRMEGEAPGTRRLVRRVTLVAGENAVRLETLLDKTSVRDKESAHAAFPFHVPDAQIRVDQGEALVTILEHQLPGSCGDFIAAHTAIDVSNLETGVSLATLDAPLVEIGAITDERRPGGAPRSWRQAAAPGSTVFAYLLNNYWHTNYKADQEGEMRFRFVLEPHGPFDPAALRRLGADVEQPLLVSRVDGAAAVTPPPFRLPATPVVVSALRPLEKDRGLHVRLYNPTGAPAAARLGGLWRGRTVVAASPDGERTLTDPVVELAPFASVDLEVRKAAPAR